MASGVSSTSICKFQNKVLTWWKTNSRDLPWRRNNSPYNVLISEVMLQQTQVSRVIPKYHEFMNAFPTLKDLAEADTRSLLQVWSGLGYNRRALWLREAAQQLVELGEFPQNVEELRKLKGLGPYTSRSILIFAFNQDLVTIDTNIRRVLIANGYATEEMSETELQDVAEHLLPKGRSCDWHNALMDLGATVQTARTTRIAPTSSQPRFERSSRQLRGAIVRVLTFTDTLSLNELVSQLDIECSNPNEVREALGQLVSEGLVACTDNGEYTIPEC
ncbi:MAG: Fe-S cluster assembly protein HesB [Candidatus Thorarchaeota archaeon]|nr:Fe-S cluster assembly protein HesB [Candidatus Thorarchaeota archaeon]